MNTSSWTSTLPPDSTSGGYDPPPGGLPSPPEGLPPPGSTGGGMTTEITALQRNLALYGYLFLFLIGFFGHVNSILIFSSRTLRSVSTSCLFIIVAISDIVYLLVCIYDFLYTGVGLTPIDSKTNAELSNALCRFRSFVQSVAMCSSAWLLVGVSMDRWFRVRFPFKVKKMCTRRRVLCDALIILALSMTLNSHLLLPSFGSLSGSSICGPISSSTYSFFFRQVWGILFTCFQTVLPTSMLIVVTVDTFRRLHLQHKRKLDRNSRRRAFMDRQMLIIMLTSIFLFFATQIPLSLFNILLSPVLQSRLTMTQALDLTALFDFVASINFASTFYVHCLTNKLFRREFCHLKRCYRRGRVGVVTQMLGADVTRTQFQIVRAQPKDNQAKRVIESLC